MQASSNPLSVSASSPPEQIASASSLAASSAETVLRDNAGSEISSVTSLDRVFDAPPSQDELELAGSAIQGLMQRHSPSGSENNQLLPRATPDQQTITMSQPVQQIFHSFNLVQALPVALAAVRSLGSDPELWNITRRNPEIQALARSLTGSDLSGFSTNVTGFGQGAAFLTIGAGGMHSESLGVRDWTALWWVIQNMQSAVNGLVDVVRSLVTRLLTTNNDGHLGGPLGGPLGRPLGGPAAETIGSVVLVAIVSIIFVIVFRAIRRP